MAGREREVEEVPGGSVRSEVGRLRQVLVHRPGEELRRLTPSNKDALLFDELLWVERAQEEHDLFAATLRDAGVEVLELTGLLAEVLTEPGLARSTVLAHVTARSCGPQAVERVRRFLLDLSARELAAALIAGVALDEVEPAGGLVGAVTPPTEMWLDPLPNAVFMRDSSAWVGEGVVLASMRRLARQRETALLRLVYTHHPRFDGSRIWYGEGLPATFEGGDLLMVAERGVAVGLSQRTTPAAVEELAVRLFDGDVVDRVLAVELPKVRATMHLDTVVAQVDADAFLTYPALSSALRAWQLTSAGEARVAVTEARGLRSGLAWSTGRDAVRVIEPELSSTRAAREQWNDANNTLALRPGVVVAYERNVATNQTLVDAGVTVRTIPSYELPRGRGGPRCMTCPVRREPVPPQ